MTNKKIKLQYDENTHIIEIVSKTNCIKKIKNNISVSLIVSMLSFIISILAFLVSYNQNVLYKDELMVNLPVFNLSDEIETEEACKYDINENKCLIHKIKNTGGEISDSYVEVNYYWDFIFKHNDKKFVYRLEILDCFNNHYSNYNVETKTFEFHENLSPRHSIRILYEKLQSDKNFEKFESRIVYSIYYKDYKGDLCVKKYEEFAGRLVPHTKSQDRYNFSHKDMDDDTIASIYTEILSSYEEYIENSK